MNLEIAHIDVKPDSEETFVQGVSAAAPLFQRARGCRGLSLLQGIESPSSLRLLVDWDMVDHHTVHFRGSDDFQRWRELVAQCFANPPRVEHELTVLHPF